MASKALILIEGHRSIGPLYVRAAQRRGLYPITMSIDPTQYGYLAAEGTEAVQVDTNDLDAMKSVYSRLRLTHAIAGLTGFSGLDESVYVTVGKLCRHFSLPGPDPASIEQCHDKFVQRQLLAQAGIPLPDYRVAMNATEVECAAAEIGLPVVIKPVVGSGSSGVRLCHTAEELAKHAAYLLGGTRITQSTPKILIEEFAQGQYYNVDTMGHQVVGVGTAEFDCPPHFVFREVTFPAPLGKDEHERIVDLSLSCLQALGLGWGPANIELRWTKRGPVVIEVNPRLGAGPQLVNLAYGIDLVTEHIKLATGGKCALLKKRSHTAAWRYLIPDLDGTLDWIDGGTQAAAIPGIAEVKLYAQPKMPIIRKGDSEDCIGYVIAASPSRDQTATLLQQAVDLVNWTITPFRDGHC
ncbi:ATP-grasp domain-containing protein [Rhizobium bangladeshense]|uniref:ATP-grasp domain-containing protein n=1 Tax=Rhizobium bangladeshense TaxID=1138189 RepID=UPI001A9814A6|nr:acetyl-CoA carboxylase biotin carboxylase subunit family protein [Rhizobium bangladeshense]MBX4935258.1 ATP-grasp domain-containing protein [Rhizobium bangladeshense]QSY91947.1 acetyl-CoA carboxylase biotin carboxylase subunit family protein [Rhizobium bangladeshense]